MAKAVLRMNKARAEELLAPLLKGTAEGISQHWQSRMIEALEYVIETETAAQQAAQQADGADWCCPECNHTNRSNESECYFCFAAKSTQP